MHGEHRGVQTAFRLPEDLRDRLREQAEREDRTMTAVVIRALEAYLGLRWPFRVGGVDLPESPPL